MEPRVCYQLNDLVAKIAVFENHIAEYKDVFEKRKRKIPPFADQKTRIDDTPSVNTKLEAEPFK